MKKLSVALAVVISLVLLLIPISALADTAPVSEVQDGLVWGDGINANTVHNTWYSAGRHWVVFVQDVPEIERNIVCSSTDDYGATWDSLTVVGNITTLFRGVAVWYQEATNILHIAYTDMGNSTDNVVWYLAATPNSNGTLTYLDSPAMPEGISIEGALGSIAIACYNLDYSLTGFEIDKDYYDGACKRLEEHKKQIRLFDEVIR